MKILASFYELKLFIEMLTESGGYDSYNPKSKEEFKRLGHFVCMDLAECLKAQITYNFNAGGVAVSGDHHAKLTLMNGKMVHVFFGAEMTDLGICYRMMRHSHDSTGEINNWCKWDELETLPKKIKQLVGYE